MDLIDKQIINRIQSNFPILKEPYKKIAKEFDITEKDLIDRIKKLKENGIIRRIGGNINPYQIGFVSTLCAASVPKNKIEIFTAIVNSYSGVTHNYIRENKFNVWFTFIASSREEISKSLKEISKKTGVKNILNLPAEKLFKVSAQFSV